MNKMEEIISLCKRVGIAFPSGEAYGGLSGFWDYGPLGAKLKKNIRDLWWRDMVRCTPPHYQTRKPLDIVPIEASIITNPRVWETSGHTARFFDTYLICPNCHAYHRADRWQIEDGCCKNCNNCEEVFGPDKHVGTKNFDLMFGTEVGSDEDGRVKAYLRPETAQSIFLNFYNVLNTSRVKIPFGIAQVGKAFRNEVAPRNFTFRSREFEQMEIEWFCKADEAPTWYNYWIKARMKWWESIGLPTSRLHIHVHDTEELAHYAFGGCGVTDIEYDFPFGRGEIEGIAHRTDFDMKAHANADGVAASRFEYLDSVSGERYFPHVVEPSAGLDRAMLAVICEAFTEDLNRPSRFFMAFSPSVAPVKFAIFPLIRNDELVELAEHLYGHYRRFYSCYLDTSRNIGKRYARADEIGTPFCITVDHETLVDDSVTIRDRDTMVQERIELAELGDFLASKFGYAGLTGNRLLTESCGD